MAGNLNKVMLIGNLTRDPELKYIPSGQAVATFTVAVNRSYVLQNGEKKEDTAFIRIVVWGRIAEICGEYLSKGRSVFVEGRLQNRSWEAEGGQKRSTIEVVAQSVQFLDRAAKASNTYNNSQSVNNTPRDTSSAAAPSHDGFGVIGSDPSLDDEVPF